MKSNAFVCLNKVVDGSLKLNVRRKVMVLR